MNTRELFILSVVVSFLFFIIYLGVWVRLPTIDTPTVLDFDPWWFYRLAQTILNNNLRTPAWDIQSFSLPGRPVGPFKGWPYTIVFFYKILRIFFPIDLMQAAILSPLLMVALIPIPAFLLGRLLTNNLGGLVTALFAVLMPAFIGVSMAGYSDSDAPVAFYFFLSVFATLLAVKKPKQIYIAFAILANLLFVWNWGGGWITLILFTVFTFALPIFRVIEDFIHTFAFKVNIKELIKEMVVVGQPIFITMVLTNILGSLLFNSTQFGSFFGGLAFTGMGGAIRWVIFFVLLAWNSVFAYYFFRLVSKHSSVTKKTYFSLCLLASIFLFYLIFLAFSTAPLKPLLVNISVAELQPINIFSREGFLSVADRVGLLPTVLSFGLFGLALYKIWKKERISVEEIFFFIWLLSMFLLISRGVRFGLQFSIAAAVAGGYVIAHYKNYPLVLLIIMIAGLLLLQQVFLGAALNMVGLLFIVLISFLVLYKKEYRLAEVLILGIFVFQLLFFLSSAIQVGQFHGARISKNWYDALDWLAVHGDRDTMVVTWWDPGHILAGYSYYKGNPLKVMADGAHCSSPDCIPYDHDIRIQDMGRVFATSSEEEAISILEKYTQLSEEQCQSVKSTFGDTVYDNVLGEDPCKPIDKMYLIASVDLIGKYYWLSYFGTGTGRNYFQLPFSRESRGSLLYGDGIISLVLNDSYFIPIMNIPEQGIRNRIVQRISYMQAGGQVVTQDYSDRPNNIPGFVWAVPTYGAIGSTGQLIVPYYVIYMQPEIENSLFTRMFFYNGEGLKHFKLRYQNPEVKIFEVIF